MNNIDYIYDNRNDCWSAYFGSRLLCSISRNYVLEYKLELTNSLESELECFRRLFSEVLLTQIEYAENEFFVSAILTKLFDCAI